MKETTTNETNFIGYEYRDVTATRNMEPVYVDGYTNFGWILDSTASSVKGISAVTLKFKRDRKIRNKAELTRLQRQFEGCVNEIESLERSKLFVSSTAAYAVGLVGTAFMAGSVFAYIGGALFLSIVCAVPGFIGWVLPYFLFRSISGKRSAKVAPMIDQKYDEIYEVCEKANGLLPN